jgi:cytoskeleton protein RodZ
MSVGPYLKEQRSLREIELDDVAKVTKISKQWLEAIESEEFDVLPGRAFVRGYIRAYANFMGLDVDDVMLRLDDDADTQ